MQLKIRALTVPANTPSVTGAHEQSSMHAATLKSCYGARLAEVRHIHCACKDERLHDLVGSDDFGMTKYRM